MDFVYLRLIQYPSQFPFFSLVLPFCFGDCFGEITCVVNRYQVLNVLEISFAFVFVQTQHNHASVEMLFPPLFAADMADMMKEDAGSEVAGFEVLESSKEDVGLDQPPGLDDGQNKSEPVSLAPKRSAALFNDESDECEVDDEDIWSMPDEAWKTVKELTADPCNRVKMGSIAMRYIESEGKGKEVPKKSLAKDGKDANDDTAAFLQILLVGMCNLADRCTALEEAAKEGAAASSSKEGAAASSSKASDVQPARKTKTVATSLDAYDLPTLEAWSTDDGRCDQCGHSWSTKDCAANFSVEGQVWETIMKKMFADWSADKMRSGQKCHLLDSYIHTAWNVANSLAVKEIIYEDESTSIEERLRNQLFQPDVRGDQKPLWLYQGGQKDNKYLTFGCIYCQRATTLYYSHESFRQQLSWYF